VKNKIRQLATFTSVAGVCVAIGIALSACNPQTNFGSDVVPVLTLQSSAAIFNATYSTDNKVPQRTDVFGFDNAGDGSTSANELLIGVLRDPQFGTIRAASYFTLAPNIPGDLAINDVDLQVDSVHLYVGFSAVYGDGLQNQQLEIYPLNDTLSLRRAYTSNDSVLVDRSVDYVLNTAPDQRQFSFAPTTLDRTLKIRLDNSLGQRLLQQEGKNVFGSSTNFQRALRGLYVAATPTGAGLGALHTLNMGAVRLEIKYSSRDSASGPLRPRYRISPSDTATYRINPLTAQVQGGFFANQVFTSLRRTAVTGTLLNQVLTTPTIANQYMLVQGGNLVRVNFRVLNTDTVLKNSAINDAVLTLRADPAFFDSPDSLLRPPIRLYLYTTLSDSVSIDPNVFPVTGNYNAVTRSYSFGLRSILQIIRSRPKLNYGAVIVPAFRHRRAQRVVLGGPNHPTPALRPTLQVLYTVAP